MLRLLGLQEVFHPLGRVDHSDVEGPLVGPLGGTPVRCRISPGTLRVRVPRHRPGGRPAGAPSGGWPRLSGERFTAVIPADRSRTGQSTDFRRPDGRRTPLSGHTARRPASHTTERVRCLPCHRPG
ncbi:hypothetical protein DKG71_01735 [Streptomyces sp. NEAU-S7GS2]|nr:hypothetical protein DKG71_01735 [Streptomyces sp. NEAU-S7GS2]